MNALDGDGFSVYTERNPGKNSRTRDSGNCRRDALTVGKQNFIEILRSPIPITVSRVERQDAVGRRLFIL